MSCEETVQDRRLSEDHLHTTDQIRRSCVCYCVDLWSEPVRRRGRIAQIPTNTAGCAVLDTGTGVQGERCTLSRSSCRIGRVVSQRWSWSCPSGRCSFPLPITENGNANLQSWLSKCRTDCRILKAGRRKTPDEYNRLRVFNSPAAHGVSDPCLCLVEVRSAMSTAGSARRERLPTIPHAMRAACGWR